MVQTSFVENANPAIVENATLAGERIKEALEQDIVDAKAIIDASGMLTGEQVEILRDSLDEVDNKLGSLVGMAQMFALSVADDVGVRNPAEHDRQGRRGLATQMRYVLGSMPTM